MSKQKDVDYDLFRTATEVICEYSGIDKILKYYEMDKVNLPLMTQENYIVELNNFLDDDNDKFVLCSNIAQSLSKSDVIENHIYGSQNWNIYESHGFFSCVVPSFLMHEGIKKENRNFRLAFPADLNKTSIKKINKKNIVSSNKFMTNMNINDYLYLNKIMRKLIDENKMEDCLKLLDNYEMNIKNIEKILKIDKLKQYKFIKKKK